MKCLLKYLKNILIYTALFLILSLMAPLPERATAQERPLVLAFYYAWFDQNTWTSGQSVDLPAEPYRSADRATIERHVAQAQGAGINAFVQSWYGPQEANNQTETNFRTLLEVAAATGFRAAVDVEVSGPFFGDAGAVANALSTLLATHAQHPGYLRYQGKPVIFFWRQQRFSVEQWTAMRNQVDPNRDTYWIAEGTDLSYQAVFDGHHLYSIAWSGAPANELAKWGDRLRAYEADNGVDRLWVATVMPGYNDTRLPRENAFAVPRRDGGYYRETWQGAVASGAEMLIINSFNEWPEGTHIEPSAGYGTAYLDITRDLVDSLGGAPPPQEAVRAGAIPAAQESPPDDEGEADDGGGEAGDRGDETDAALETPDEPFVRIGGLVNVRSGPSTDFEQVGQLTAGETAPVVGQVAAGDWWQIEFPAGEDGLAWVAERVVEFVGERTAVAVVDPAAEPTVELPSLTAPPGGITVRERPDTEAESLGRLTAGRTTTVVGQDETGAWWQIEYQNQEADEADNAAGTVGWVAAALVDLEGERSEVPVIVLTDEEDIFPTPTPTPTPLVVAGRIVSDDAINVRAEPTVDSALVGGLYLGDRADVYAISEDGAWWQIEFPDGPDGLAWVAAEFVRFQGNEANVPIYGLGTPTPTPGPTDTPTATPIQPTATAIQFPPTFAPTATSAYQGTAAALLEERGTPDPSLSDVPATRPAAFNWGNLPWGLISITLIAAFVWYQWRRQSS